MVEQLSFKIAEDPTDLIAFVDGGSRGNPGEAGFGVVLQTTGGEIIREIQGYLGESTNNVAEYRALIAALETARQMGCKRIRVFSDSQLIVSQVRGFYRVTAAHLLPLYQQVQSLIREFASFSITYVPREQNQEADRLANAAIDQKTPWP